MRLVSLFAEERQLAEGDDVFSRDGPGDGGGGGDGSSGHSDSDIDGDGGVAIRGTSLPLIHGIGGRCTGRIKILFQKLAFRFQFQLSQGPEWRLFASSINFHVMAAGYTQPFAPCVIVVVVWKSNFLRSVTGNVSF